MGIFFKSTKGSLISELFELREDIGQIKAGWMVDVALYDDHLEIKEMLSKKKPPITLNYSQITDVFYGMETEIVTKAKSPIGRAVAGGLLFGGVGAVVGAVSGTGEKTQKVNKFYFLISYTSSAGEPGVLQFQDTRLLKGRKVANKLKELCGIVDAPPEEPVTSL